MPTVKSADGLTEKQRRFVTEYAITLNATDAVRKAGYNQNTDTGARVLGCRLLKNPKVKSQLNAELAKRAARTQVTQDNVIEMLLTEATRFGKGSSHSARVRAIELLGKHQGMFADAHTVDMTV